MTFGKDKKSSNALGEFFMVEGRNQRSLRSPRSSGSLLGMGLLLSLGLATAHADTPQRPDNNQNQEFSRDGGFQTAPRPGAPRNVMPQRNPFEDDDDFE